MVEKMISYFYFSKHFATGNETSTAFPFLFYNDASKLQHYSTYVSGVLALMECFFNWYFESFKKELKTVPRNGFVIFMTFVLQLGGAALSYSVMNGVFEFTQMSLVAALVISSALIYCGISKAFNDKINFTKQSLLFVSYTMVKLIIKMLVYHFFQKKPTIGDCILFCVPLFTLGFPLIMSKCNDPIFIFLHDRMPKFADCVLFIGGYKKAEFEEQCASIRENQGPEIVQPEMKIFLNKNEKSIILRFSFAETKWMIKCVHTCAIDTVDNIIVIKHAKRLDNGELIDVEMAFDNENVAHVCEKIFDGIFLPPLKTVSAVDCCT